MEISILVGIMLALCGISFIVGSTVQKMIDNAKLSAEQEKTREYRETLERERREAAAMQREERRRHEEERKAVMIRVEDLEQALRGEQLRVDIYKKGGRW